MKKFFLALAVLLGCAVLANASNYSINDSDIDALIACAEETPSLDIDAVDFASASSSAVISEKSDAVALVLCFLVGGFGVHRHYMGTAPAMWALYTFTFGGIFGIVPFVDFIVMLIDLVEDNGFGAYYGNTKFFMWA